MRSSDAIIETRPIWIGRLLNDVLPEGPPPVATYYSWTHDVRAVPVLAVLPTALLAVEMAFVDRSEELLNVSVAAVPLDRVARVGIASRAWLGPEPGSALQSVDIEIDGDLAPFGSSIRLPIAQNDYRGDTDVARQAALRIAESLIAALPAAPGRDHLRGS